MENEDVCAVCICEIGENDGARYPGCGHRFHVRCIINYAQYDARCPVCRGVGDGVEQRMERERTEVVFTEEGVTFRAEGEAATTIVDMYEEGMRDFRRYAERRRRLLKRRHSLKERVDRLKSIRKSMKEEYALLQKDYDAKCYKVWSSDPEIQIKRKVISNLRRRELRLERRVDTDLEEELGEPSVRWG